ncbi:nucleoside 2-deoxyribosyltransferase [Martelella alba]|uniref:Nucleoside 2-deoxyribosyltransferase n=1 Tax=Martelella alba TaxID=2590451 RepID=A0A506U8L0_9HYPH|nr:nucleoside 2-deoxyribosyltransferase [Martelella alba]TPW30762.1 nucleoside 2-deoxyribosyltransferase [Martelella alba]
MTVKVYMAGPEIFFENGLEIIKIKADMVRAAGLEPLSPGDRPLPPCETPFETGMAISASDEEMMLESDAIIANLTPFRGISADPGTIFEVGFMCALNKPVFAYSNIADGHTARLMDYYRSAVTRASDGFLRGPDGMMVEDCDMTENLMVDGGILRRHGILTAAEDATTAALDDLTEFRKCLVKASARLKALA